MLQVNCTGNNDCQHKYIDASAAYSLTIECENCYGVKIQCPIGPNTFCNINCDYKDWGCYNMEIEAESTTNLSVLCTTTNGCGNTHIINGPTNEANIQCITDTSNACPNSIFTLSNTNIVRIECNCSTASSCCNYNTIYAENAEKLTMNCGGKNGDCASTEIHANFSLAIELNCDAHRTCSYQTIYAQYGELLRLNCNGIDACIYSNIYPPSADAANQFIMSCLGKEACDFVTISVNENYATDYMALTCSEGGCNDFRFECTSSFSSMSRYSLYSIIHATEKCDKWGVVGCCPWFYGQTITCPKDQCYIRDSVNASDSIINGTHSETLTVNCALHGNGGISGCENTQILCPNYGNCIVRCMEDNACDNVEIILGTTALNNATSSLLCEGDCHNIVIKGKYATSVIMECTASKCENITVLADSARKVSGFCYMNDVDGVDHGCHNIIISANNVNFFRWQCRYFGACSDNTFYIDHANASVISAYGESSFYQNEVYARGGPNRFDIICNGDLDDRACIDSIFYVMSSGQNVRIYCYETACYRMGVYQIDDLYDMEIFIYSCDQCDGVNQCMDTFYVQCADSNGEEPIEAQCDLSGSDDTDCDCESVANNVKFIKTTNCLPSAVTTTIQPTHSPTPVTSSPTTSPIMTMSTTNVSTETSASEPQFDVEIATLIIIVVVCACCVIMIVMLIRHRKKDDESTTALRSMTQEVNGDSRNQGDQKPEQNVELTRNEIKTSNIDEVVDSLNNQNENSQIAAANEEKNVQRDQDESSDGSYHSSHSDPIYPYKYAVQKRTSGFKGLDNVTDHGTDKADKDALIDGSDMEKTQHIALMHLYIA